MKRSTFSSLHASMVACHAIYQPGRSLWLWSWNKVVGGFAPIDNLSALYNQRDFLSVSDIVKRVLINDKNVRQLAGCDGA
jgi:hypothetical protein